MYAAIRKVLGWVRNSEGSLNVTAMRHVPTPGTGIPFSMFQQVVAPEALKQGLVEDCRKNII
jgi:hypothetical protein